MEVTNRLDENPDPNVLKVIAPYRVSVDSVIAPVLGKSTVGMSASRPESLLSNWAADVMVELSEFDGGKRADLGVINVGGLRNNMPKGDVRKGDIMLISPFENKLVVVYLKGEDLLGLMKDIAAVHGEGISREVRMQITKAGELKDVKISGKSIEPEQIYRVATLDYLAEGNDKLYSFKKALQIKESGMLSRDAMMESVKRAGTITASIEGRIVETE